MSVLRILVQLFLAIGAFAFRWRGPGPKVETRSTVFTSDESSSLLAMAYVFFGGRAYIGSLVFRERLGGCQPAAARRAFDIVRCSVPLQNYKKSSGT